MNEDWDAVSVLADEPDASEDWDSVSDPAEQDWDSVSVPAPTDKKPFFGVGDTLSGIWDAVSGLQRTAPAAYYRMKEGLARPDQYSPEAREAFNRERIYTKRMEEETLRRQLEGTSTSVGETFREVGPSLGFSTGALTAGLGGRLAGAGAGLAAGLVIPDPGPAELIGTVGGFLGAGTGAGVASYRMAGAQFLDDAFEKLNEDSMAKNGRPMTEEEMAKSYEALKPVAENTALWEAGPEAISNAVMLGLGKIAIFGPSREASRDAFKEIAKRAAQRIGAGAGVVGSELTTETITQLGQGADQAKLEAFRQGLPMDKAVSPYDRPGGTLQAFKDIAPVTLAQTALIGAGAKGVQLATKPFFKTQSEDVAETPSLPTPEAVEAEVTSIRESLLPVAEENAAAGNPLTAEALAQHAETVAEQRVEGMVTEAEEQAQEAAEAQAEAQEEKAPETAPAAPAEGAVAAPAAPLTSGPTEAGAVQAAPISPEERARLGLPAWQGGQAAPQAAPESATESVETAAPAQSPIEAAMAAFGEGSVRASAERIAEGKDMTVRNPEAVSALKSSPIHTFRENPDGSLTITGVLHPDTKQWVGVAPQNAPTSEQQRAADIERGMEAMGKGAAAAGREEMARRLAAGEEMIYRTPAAVAGIKADPNLTWEELPDGGVRVTGVNTQPSPFESRLRAKDEQSSTPEGRQARRLQDHQLVTELNAEIGRQKGVKGVKVKVASESRVPPEFSRFRNLFESLFNRRIVLVEPQKKGTQGWHGVRFGAGNNIFINIDSPVNSMAVLGHEFMHTLESTNPELYAELVEAVQRLGIITDQQIEAYGKKYLKGIYGKENWKEEVINNIIGDRFFDGELFSKLAQQEPALFARLVEVIREWIANVRNKLASAHGYDMAQRLGLDETSLKRIDDLLTKAIRDAAHQELEKTDAVPIQSSEGVSVRQSPESGQGVPSTHAEERQTAAESREDIAPSSQEEVKPPEFSATNHPLPKERTYIQRAIEQHGEDRVQQVWNELQSDMELIEGQSKLLEEASQAELEGPTEATKQERKYKDGQEVGPYYREPIPDSTMRLVAARVLQNAAWLHGGGYTREFGKEVMKYIRGGYSLPGVAENPALQAWLALDLIQNSTLQGELGLDGAEVKRALSTKGTQIGRGLRAFRELYQPLEKLEKEAQEVTDKAMKENGIENPEEFAKATLDAIEEAQTETVKAMTPETREAIAEQAKEDAQEAGWFEGAMGAFDAERQALLQRLKTLLQKINEIRQRMESLPDEEASMGDVAFSLPETRAELQAELDKLVGEANDILDQLFKKRGRARTRKAKPEEVEQEAQKTVAEEESAKQEQESSDALSEWVKGKPVEGVESFEDALKRFLNPNGFNRDAFSNWLQSKFPNASPVMIQSVVNNAADVVDGKAVEEAPVEAQGEQTEKVKKTRKRQRKIKDAAEEAQKAKEKAIKSVVSKLKKPKVPDLAKTNKFIKALVQTANSDIVNSETVRDAFALAYDLHGLTKEKLKELSELIRDIEAMPDGMPKQTALMRVYKLVNALSPSSELMAAFHQALMGSVLSGVSTMTAQFSGATRAVNPFQAAWQFMAMTDPKALRNPANFFKVWWDIMKKLWLSVPMVRVGAQGTFTGDQYGLGVSPAAMAHVRPDQMNIGLMRWADLPKMRIGRQPWLRAMLGTEPKTELGKTLKKIALTPAWLASRSFAMIRAAEALSGNMDKNITFEMIAVRKLVEEGSTWNKAYNTVRDWMSPQTNQQMWSEAEKQAKEEIGKKEVSPHALKFRTEEIVQDKLDKEHKLKVENRHREMSAWLNFKADPLTRAGSWFAKDIMEKAPTPVKMVFLFSRFFANVIETAIFNSPLGYIHMGKERAAKGAQNEREKRIEATFGSLDNYRKYRDGLASSSVVSTFIAGTAMALAYSLWKWMDEDDEDTPPMFWITGSNAYDSENQMKLSWWRPNTLFLRIPGTDTPLAINYVQANPQLAITLQAVGNVADRIMFPEMLNYSVDPRTGERKFSAFKSIIKPIIDASAAPASRSTYVTFQQAVERSFQGNPQSLLKLLSRPVGETAFAVTLGGPGTRDAAKLTKPEIPRTSKTAKQAILSGIPFAAQLGLDTGLPILNAFGEPSSGYSYFPFLSKEQETSKTVENAAELLNEIGVTKAGMREWVMDADTVEIAHDGKRYALSLRERERVLGDIGKKFAGELVRNRDQIRSRGAYAKQKKAVDSLLRKSRESVLRMWRRNIVDDED